MIPFLMRPMTNESQFKEQLKDKNLTVEQLLDSDDLFLYVKSKVPDEVASLYDELLYLILFLVLQMRLLES
jgi:hypothetical protein